MAPPPPSPPLPLAPPPPPPVAPPTPPDLRVIEVDVPPAPGAPPEPVSVLADSPEEAFTILHDIGRGVAGSGARHLYYGSVIEPIRDAYKLRLERVEAEILRRRAALGANPNAYELRGLAQWAARERTRTARLWRIPTPALMAGLEARDWQKYGVGGRTFENLVRRNAAQGRVGPAAWENILRSATTPNPEVSRSVARGAQFLRRGGGVLAVAGLAVSAHEIYNAPPGERGQLAARTGVGLAGGLVGTEIAVGLLAVGAGLLAATPPGWVILAVGLIGGIAGGVIADRVFFPAEVEPVARHLGDGYPVDPQRLGQLGTAGRGGGREQATTLPLVPRVLVVIEPRDTVYALSWRGHFLAARAAGLPVSVAQQFADGWATDNLVWTSGDPSPSTDGTVRPADLTASAGARVAFGLSDAHRAELIRLQGAHLGDGF